MNPTPEQVAQWAREAGMTLDGRTVSDYDLQKYMVFVTRAMAEQAEVDAKLCDAKVGGEFATGKVDHNEMGWTQACAAAIRANAPKVMT